MSGDLLRTQAEWLAPARARLLRRAGIAHRRRILDLGSGRGAVTGELVRRSADPSAGNGSLVVALDRDVGALRADPDAFAGAARVAGDAACLPFRDAAFDLVFCQCALMWMHLPRTAGEIRRVLQPDGVLVAIEPDYGGMIEYPEAIATRDLWVQALLRAGADPFVGRKLPPALSDVGLEVRTDLIPELAPPSPARFQLLRTLPLTDDEEAHLSRVERMDEEARRRGPTVVHLPFFLVTAAKLSVGDGDPTLHNPWS